MTVVIEPDWSFEQALDAAWHAYGSQGRQFGATNRIRVLEQWANVVGRERASHELDAALSTGVDTGLSEYAVRKLRKAFGSMPDRTRRRTDLFTFLRSLPSRDFPNELSLSAKALPEFAEVLGYAQDHLFYEPALRGERRLRPDAVIADNRLGRPGLVIETKLLAHRRPQVWDEAVVQLRDYLDASGAAHAVLLTPQRLRVLSADRADGEEYDLATISRDQANDLHARLGAIPSTRQTHAANAAIADAGPALGDGTLRGMLDAVVTASTNDAKKKTLERLAARLVEGVGFVRCKYVDLMTKSSEIDIVGEYLGHSQPTLFDDYGRYFLVECKNWKEPIDAKSVRDFLGKLQKTRARLGVIFSRSGITGTRGGTDGLRELHAAFDRDGTSAIVLSEDDLRTCVGGRAFYELLDDKLDRLRFDL